MVLSDAKVGKKLRIHSLIKDELTIKLMEMGCLPGETITIEKKGLTGDPISIKISGYYLSLRTNEAEKIIVEEI